MLGAMAFDGAQGRIILENTLKGVLCALFGALLAIKRTGPAFGTREDHVDKYASEWLFIAHFDAES
jgi:hypothetical protein